MKIIAQMSAFDYNEMLLFTDKLNKIISKLM